MARKPAKPKAKKSIESLTHGQAKRTNIPTAEYQAVMRGEEEQPIRVAYQRRNRDLDPQLVWRGKDEQNWSDLVVQAPPLYIQEKIHPKVLIDDLRRQTEEGEREAKEQLDLFADFNGLPSEAAKTEFYQHEANWSNRMILGDSLQVMASLAEREGLRGRVQMIYIDPPYGIKFNSNFQWSTTSRDVKDGKAEHITREPEQVKAFRDTWRDGIHSYLTYLRDRLTVARDLLTESGSIFVQIGDENVHRVRALMDEVFGDENFVALIKYKTTGGRGAELIDKITNYIIWYAKRKEIAKYRNLLQEKGADSLVDFDWIEYEPGKIEVIGKEVRHNGKPYMLTDFTSQGEGNPNDKFEFQNEIYYSRTGRHWTTNEIGRRVLTKANRVQKKGKNVFYRKFFHDYPVATLGDVWFDTSMGGYRKKQEKIYVVQTASIVVERCLLMTTDPGDLVLDPTCGSGTTAYVAEQWGRRWITIDTSRVALALARARIMGARYPYYLLADSPEGRRKEAEISGKVVSGQRLVDSEKSGDQEKTHHLSLTTQQATHHSIRQGFVYERVPHITLKSIANNAEIDVIYEKWQPRVLEALAGLNKALRGHPKPFKVSTGGRQGKAVRFDAPDGEIFTMPSGEEVKAYELVEWEVPRDFPQDWPQEAREPHEAFWQARIARQKEIDASIAAKADYEYLYDKPYTDNKKVRVAGPFTVESLSPHRVLAVDENDELIDQVADVKNEFGETVDFVRIILDNLKSAGVQQAHKEDRIQFTYIHPWPGEYVCAEGEYMEGETPRRVGIFIGPEFGTVSRPDLVAAAREAGDAGFDALITCAFNYDAHSSEFEKLGRIPVLKARMNADLHMADDLKNTGKGNLFVIFGEPDIDILDEDDNKIRVRVNGVDVFHPQTGEVRSDGPEGIACWFIDTDYNEESFFVRHAYFIGAGDPYKSLKTTLKAEINAEAWQTLYSDVSRPFARPESGRIAVKIINHLGDEVMKVFRV